ncbi:hypothetical protein TESG_02847 [Trichophyton tonsurans CBS 112818]|uniref:Uncharacterized protein n=1 Tax=Trichophyton tonsurans (strain CBS 112818) TaxID=647933 RepID=F2RVL2_TRIT1|nr:hypothetical protein TESG_02847 [Trichophyton tonsurans CBS 112818]
MNQPRYYDDATPWGTIFAESKPSRFRMAQGAVFLPLRLHGDIDTLNSSSTVYCVKMIILTLGHSLLLDRPGNQPIVPALSMHAVDRVPNLELKHAFLLAPLGSYLLRPSRPLFTPRSQKLLNRQLGPPHALASEI